MKTKINWKEMGRFNAVLVQLFTVITQVFKKAKVGPEIIEWFVGAGKDTFVGKLEELAVEFVKANPPESPITLKAEVDTDLDPKLPFDGAKICREKSVKMGRVVIERRGDELFVNSKKVVLRCVTRQLNGRLFNGHELREELTDSLVLNARVLDFLLEHTDFIPESWKKHEYSETIYIFFWGTIYRFAGGRLCVRCLCWGSAGFGAGITAGLTSVGAVTTLRPCSEVNTQNSEPWISWTLGT